MAFTSTKTLQAPGETTLTQTAQGKMGRSVQNLSSEGWLCSGIAGELKLEDGRLSYTARAQFRDFGLLRFQRDWLERHAHPPGLADRMGRGEKCVVFEARITDVEAEFPWYSFGSGIKIRVGGAKYFFVLSTPSYVHPEKDIVGNLTQFFLSAGGSICVSAVVFIILKLIKVIRLQSAWKNALREQIR